MDQTQNKEEIDKMFDLVEAPIVKWIAKYLNLNESDLVKDRELVHDTIRTEIDGVYYDIFATCEPEHVNENGTAFLYKMYPTERTKWIMSHENAKHSIGLLMQAVMNVYVTMAIMINREELLHTVPVPDDNALSFTISKYNKFMKAYIDHKRYVEQAISEIIKVRQAPAGALFQLPEGNVTADEMVQKLNGLIKVSEDKMIAENINEQTVKAEQGRCNEFNEANKNKLKLYISIREVNTNDIDNDVQAMKRLPTFGQPFRDDTVYTDDMYKKID